jgi:hypothetical protein
VSNVSTCPELSPSQAIEFLETLVQAGPPILIESSPGLGKSAVVRQVAARLWKGQEYVFADIRSGQIDGSLIAGLPCTPKMGKDGVERANFAPLSIFPDRGPGFIFCDELDKAEIPTQNSLLELFLDRRLGVYTVPKGVHVIAAANCMTDRAGGNRLTTALISRCCKIKLTVSLEDWLAWAASADVHPLVSAFIENSPDHLYVFDPHNPEVQSFPCPRTWEAVSHYLKLCHKEELLYPMVAGCVGANASSAKFTAFARWYYKLPSKAEVLAEPDTVKLPVEASMRWCFAVALVEWVKKAPPQEQDAMIRVALRLSAELTTFFMVHFIASHPPAFKNPKVLKWATQNQAALNRRRVNKAN